MMVETFLASIAIFLWLNIEPGLVRALLFNVIWISGVSTLLFNGNPLLRFDGYYVLSDAIEIPNLGQRANQYIGYLFQRYALGSTEAESPAYTTGERFWMMTYGIASFVYRVFITFVIVLFIAGQFFVIGVLLAIWAVATQVAMPIGKSLSFLFSSPSLRRQRPRALYAASVIAGTVLIMLFVAPFPSWTRTEGVIWTPEEAIVRAGADGFFEKLLAPVDGEVKRGQPPVQSEEPFLAARVAVLKSMVEELEAKYDATLPVDRVSTHGSPPQVGEGSGVGNIGECGARVDTRSAPTIAPLRNLIGDPTAPNPPSAIHHLTSETRHPSPITHHYRAARRRGQFRGRAGRRGLSRRRRPPRARPAPRSYDGTPRRLARILARPFPG